MSERVGQGLGCRTPEEHDAFEAMLRSLLEKGGNSTIRITRDLEGNLVLVAVEKNERIAPPTAIDAIAERLHSHGWSAGDMARTVG